jgi:hypothetical protein
MVGIERITREFHAVAHNVSALSAYATRILDMAVSRCFRHFDAIS